MGPGSFKLLFLGLMASGLPVFIAMENGTSVIRQADEGLSTVVDGYGRTLATGEGLAGSGNYLRADVPTSSPTTLYPVVGDVFGILAIIGLVAVAVYALIVGRRRSDVPQTAAVPS